MHLAILSQYYEPEIGAPQARLSALSSSFVKRGHSVTVVTAMPSYPKGEIFAGYKGVVRREWRENVNVIRTLIYPTQKADYLHRLTNYFSFVLSSATFAPILLGAADYLLVESPPLFLGLAGFWLSRLKGMRLIFNVSDLWPESAVCLGVLSQGTLAHRISERIEKFCYEKAWLITGQSKEIVENIQGRFAHTSVYHLSNGVDTTLFHPECQNAAAREGLSNDASCVVIYAGLHGLAQGLDRVLAVAEMLKAEANLKFVLIGDGPEKRMLVEQAKHARLNNVTFLDLQPSNMMPPLLASADIVLVTLKTHIPGAVPSKLYEAMASGRPVVLVASGEAAKIVREHQVGIVVEQGDLVGLARAVKTLQTQPYLRRVLGANGRRAAEKYFDRHMIATRFIDHLEATL
jgi:glycosyltransferase involved in cell wall biosynthesis